MTTSRSTDVNLVVRAKTEGERAITSLADVVERLINNAGDGSGDIAELGRSLLALDKAAGGLASAQERVGASASKQAAGAHAATAAMAEQQQRAETLQRGLAILTAEADRAFIGPRRSGLNDLIRSTKSELSDAERQIARYGAALDRNLAGLRSSRSGLLELRQASAATADAQTAAAVATDLNTQALARQAAQNQRAAAAQQFYNNKFAPGRDAAANGATRDLSGAQAFAASIEEMERDALQLRAALDPLGAIQDRFNTQLARYRQLAAAGKISTDQLAAAEVHLANEADDAREALERLNATGDHGVGRRGGPFGLRPHELQNLSYQVNDVVTSLASGQNATQVIAQQGGQILQLFPRVAASLLGALRDPRIAALVAVVGGIAVGLKEAADQAERLRRYSGEVSFRSDGDEYDPKRLAATEQALERMGNKADDARAAIRAMLDEGLNPELLDRFAKAADQTADRLGMDLPTAIREIAQAFGAGYDAIAEFDNKMNFLTATEREHIRTLFEEGNAQAARTEALNAYTRRSEETASKQRGPWTDAAKSLGKAWNALVDWIADSAPIKITIAVLNELAGVVKSVGDAIADALGRDPAKESASASAAKRIGEVQSEIRKFREEIEQYQKLVDELEKKGSPAAGTVRNVLAFTKRQLADAQAELAKLEKSAPDTINGDPDSAAAKQRADDLARIGREDELQRLRDAGQSRLLSAAEQARRAELAGLEAARSATDSQVAAALKRQAVAKETAAIERESDARRKAAAAERARLAEQTQFGSPVNGRQTSGFGARKSPSGIGSTYHRGIDYAVPTGTPVRATAGGVVIETGVDAKLGKFVRIDHGNKVVSFYAHLSNNRVVEEGQQVAKGQVIAKSGNTGASTGPHLHYGVYVNDKPVDPNKGQFPKDGPGRFRTDPGVAVQDFEDKQAEALARSVERQERLNELAADEAEDRQRAVDALRAQAGLHGEALIAEQRREAIARAVAELHERAEDANRDLKPGETAAVVTQEQIDKTKEWAAALFDVQHARDLLDARLSAAQRPVDTLREQRDLLREQADYLRSIGEESKAQEIERQFDALGVKIRDAYQALIDFYQALSPEQRVQLGIIDQAQLDNIIEKLRQAQQESKQWGKVADISIEDIRQALATSASQAFTNFINKVAAGKNVFKSLGESVREFAANFIGAIAQMIVQMLALAAAGAILRALNIPIPSIPNVSSHHTGGIVGQGTGQRRNVSPSVFAGAQRFHAGGIVGLGPNEVGIIAQKGEEVLTEGNPRHRNNFGKGDGRDGDISIKNVNLFDAESAAATLLSTKTGEKVVLNLIRANRRLLTA